MTAVERLRMYKGLRMAKTLLGAIGLIQLSSRHRRGLEGVG